MENVLDREIEVSESDLELDEWDKLNADLALRRINVMGTTVDHLGISR